MQTHSWPRALTHFNTADPTLYHAYHTLVTAGLTPTEVAAKHQSEYFNELVCNIIGQQLSGKAAATIEKRVYHVLGVEPLGITPQSVLEADKQALRQAGMSYSKIEYIKNIARAVEESALQIHTFHKLGDEIILEEMQKIKGVGKWTAEMFLMFTLGRPNVFSFGDGGLQRGFKKLYNRELNPKDREIVTIINRWSPYKTYASKILWKVLELR